MIHVVTHANRALYTDALEQMHRARWQYYVEDRHWTELQAMQSDPGHERDELDDERAVYLLALSDQGDLQGSMRLRPTDDKSLLFGRFGELVAESDCKAGARVWEITRLFRAPAYRGADGALRLSINCAACEFALTRGVERLVAVIDTFLLPAVRGLHRDHHRVLGLPAAYAEGEMIAIEIRPDASWLSMGRKLAQLDCAQMYEPPPPAETHGLPALEEARIIASLRTLPPARLAAVKAVIAADLASDQLTAA